MGHATFNSSTTISNITDPYQLLEGFPSDTFNQILNNAQNLSRLSTEECIASYAPSGFGPHGNLILVTADLESTGQLYAWGKVNFSTAGKGTCILEPDIPHSEHCLSP